MANRRMFSKDITSSDAFLDMPTSTQALYFQLWMHADDDGFLWSARRIARMLWCWEDDFKILVAKKFVLVFDDWICVIKHWKMNNQIRRDRYKITVHTEKLNSLITKDNGSYRSLSTNGLPNGNHLATQYSIGEVSIGKDRIEKVPLEVVDYSEELTDLISRRNKVKKIGTHDWFMKCNWITPLINKEYKKIRKKHKKEHIWTAIGNYMKDIKGRDAKDSYSKHRFSLCEFLKQNNGFNRFYNI